METINDVQCWLEANGFSEYKEKFLDQKIDGFVLFNITERAVEELVPVIGDRIKFLMALKKYQATGTNKDDENTSISKNSNFTPSTSVDVLNEPETSPVVAATSRKPCRPSQNSPGPVMLNAKLPWPSVIELPRNFRPELTRVLQEGDPKNMTRRLRSQFLYGIYEHFSRYTLYPTKTQLTEVCLKIIKVYPFLKDISIGSGYDSWFAQLYDKFRNERRVSEDQEVILHKRKDKESSNGLERVKKCLKRGVLNWQPLFPEGEDEHSLKKHIEYMQNEYAKKKPDSSKIRKRMALTFPGRRRLMNKALPLVDIRSEFPALFNKTELLLEFERILGTTNIETLFNKNINRVSSSIIQLARETGETDDIKRFLNLLEPQEGEEDVQSSQDEISTIALTILPYFIGKQRKATESYNFLQFIDESEDLRKVVQSCTSCPRIIVQGELNCAPKIVVTAENIMICDVEGIPAGVLSFMAACYVFMFEYPANIKSYCTYIQRCILEIHDGKKLPSTIISFVNKLEQKLQQS